MRISIMHQRMHYCTHLLQLALLIFSNLYSLFVDYNCKQLIYFFMKSETIQQLILLML